MVSLPQIGDAIVLTRTDGSVSNTTLRHDDVILQSPSHQPHITNRLPPIFWLTIEHNITSRIANGGRFLAPANSTHRDPCPAFVELSTCEAVNREMTAIGLVDFLNEELTLRQCAIQCISNGEGLNSQAPLDESARGAIQALAPPTLIAHTINQLRSDATT